MVCCRDTKSHGSHVSGGQEREKKNENTANTFNAVSFLSLFIHTPSTEKMETLLCCAVTPSRM